MKSYYRPDFDAHQAGYHRAQRRRRLFVAARRGGVALALGAVIALGWAAWTSLGPGWVRARLSSLRLFRIETMQVSGNRTLTSANVFATAGLRAGESLIGLDLAAARARLVADPRVREASLRRRLPGTIVVEIVERVPCVVVRADRDYLVDAEGAIVSEAGAGTRSDLPVLKGVEAEAGVITPRGAADLAAGIELVAAIRQVGFPAFSAIDHVDLADPDDAVIVPVSGRPLVHAGRRDAAGRLRRWRLVSPDMAQRWPELEYVDLRAEGQVVAMPAAPAPPEGAEEKPGTRAPAARSPGQGTGERTGRVRAGGGHA
ncbi:MAG: cell division protein FtsQ/DivIB [Candidatus Methylomirabilia bacterium]